MRMKLVRKTGNAGFTEGRLYVDGEFECFTIEDADRKLETNGVKIQNKTAIPRGVYQVVITMSNRFNKLMPEVLNVPGFKGVRIHSGNSSKDTEGCIIVGALNDNMDDDFIGSSKVAMERLYPKMRSVLNAGQNITLEVV